MCNKCLSWKSCRLWDKAEKNCRAGEDTDDNTISWGASSPLCWVNNCVGILVYTLVCVYFPSKHNNVLDNLLYILYYSIQINYCVVDDSYTVIWISSNVITFISRLIYSNIQNLDVKIECISRLIKVINYHNARWKPETKQ
jgi:hypothetical protein